MRQGQVSVGAFAVVGAGAVFRKLQNPPEDGHGAVVFAREAEGGAQIGQEIRYRIRLARLFGGNQGVLKGPGSQGVLAGVKGGATHSTEEAEAFLLRDEGGVEPKSLLEVHQRLSVTVRTEGEGVVRQALVKPGFQLGVLSLVVDLEGDRQGVDRFLVVPPFRFAFAEGDRAKHENGRCENEVGGSAHPGGLLSRAGRQSGLQRFVVSRQAQVGRNQGGVLPQGQLERVHGTLQHAHVDVQVVAGLAGFRRGAVVKAKAVAVVENGVLRVQPARLLVNRGDAVEQSGKPGAAHEFLVQGGVRGGVRPGGLVVLQSPVAVASPGKRVAEGGENRGNQRRRKRVKRSRTQH